MSSTQRLLDLFHTAAMGMGPLPALVQVGARVALLPLPRSMRQLWLDGLNVGLDIGCELTRGARSENERASRRLAAAALLERHRFAWVVNEHHLLHARAEALRTLTRTAVATRSQQAPHVVAELAATILEGWRMHWSSGGFAMDSGAAGDLETLAGSNEPLLQALSADGRRDLSEVLGRLHEADGREPASNVGA